MRNHMVSSRIFFFLWFAIASLAVVLFAGASSAQEIEPPEFETLLIEVEDLRDNPDDGLVMERLYVVTHDGTFNLYDLNQPAPDHMDWFAAEGLINQIRNHLSATQDRGWPLEVGLQMPRFKGSNSVRNVSDAPRAYRHNQYLSFFGRLYPSNDAIIGNEDPMRYKIFDDEGVFLGPIVIDVYGGDVVDAGVRENNEEDLVWLDRSPWDRDPEAGVPTSEPVRQHPGFVGSLRNPSDEPGRLMSQVNTICDEHGSCLHYDPDNIDFTAPGTALMRIRISASARQHGAWSGSYRDPERSGEGFIIEFHGHNPVQSVFYWFTYRPDGSGEPMFLIGEGQREYQGPLPYDWGRFEYEVYETHGGRMASPLNPETVERIPWGRAYFDNMIHDDGQSPACQSFTLWLQPYDEELELDLDYWNGWYFYDVERITSGLSYLDHYCGDRSAVNIRPF